MKKGACSGRRLHWLFEQWIRTSCPLTVLFCTHVTELETQIHVRICARSGALIASAIRLSQCLHPTRPLQGATLVRHTPLAGSSGLSRAVGAGFHVVPVLPGLTARNTPYPLQISCLKFDIQVIRLIRQDKTRIGPVFSDPMGALLYPAMRGQFH